MDELTDSDVTMMAADSFNKIMCQVQNSGLNYQLKLTPFSAMLSMKKTFVKDKNGKPLLPTTVLPTKINQEITSSAISSNYSKLQYDLYASQTKQQELSSELKAAYDTIGILKKINNERDLVIKDLEKEILICKEATASINNAYNNNRIKFESEKIELFKQHKKEVKLWRRELGDMTRKHLNLERKFNSLKSEDANSFMNFVKEDLDIKEDVTIAEPSYVLTSETMCTICSNIIDRYVPNYFLGEKVNPACAKCRGDDDLLDPFSSFAIDGIPTSLVSHWNPKLFFNENCEYGALSSIMTLRSHYIKLPNPGERFTDMEDIMQEFRVLLNRRSQAFKEECKQS